MGLAPSREQYTGSPWPRTHHSKKSTQPSLSSEGALLPFISRAPEDYTYQDDSSPQAAASTAPADGDDEGDAGAGADAKASDRKGGGGKNRSADAEDADEIVYYYEHRLVPLTADFFPSDSSILFEQLCAARASQNARYHFQTTETWSPGSLLDPTTHYQALSTLAETACEELKQADPSSTGESQASQDANAASAAASTRADSHIPVPFASREDLYDFLVRTYEAKGFLYADNNALREAWGAVLNNLPNIKTAAAAQPSSSSPSRKNAAHQARTSNSNSNNSTMTRGAAALRPLPCAIALVRVPVTKAAHREIYYKSGFQRHHHTSKGSGGNGETDAAAVRRKTAQTLEKLKVIQITAQDVIKAVTEHEQQQQHEKQHERPSRHGRTERAAVQGDGEVGETGEDVNWFPVSAPHESTDYSVELRIVGVFGCWTVEEILRYSLFMRTSETARGDGGFSTGSPSFPLQAQEKARQEPLSLNALPASAEAILARARPHGVPSSTLLKVTFFEKQVGDKEQCHTYFSLLRYFARGLRDCFMQESTLIVRPKIATFASVPSGTGAEKSGKNSKESVAGGGSGEKTAMENLLPLEDDPNSLWSRFITYVVARADAATQIDATQDDGDDAVQVPDWSSALLVRFSNVPQLQLCRQIRLLVHELVQLHPEPPTVIALQESQRRRNAVLSALKPTSAANAGTETGTAGGTSDTTRPGVSQDSTSPRRSASRESPTPDELLRRAPRKASIPSLSNSTTSDPASRADLTGVLGFGNHSMGGFACYIQDGLVVVRLSHLQAARAVHQIARMPLEDSIEALAVTLTAAAPPLVTFRGELRPPMPLPITGWRDAQSSCENNAFSYSAGASATTQNAYRFVLDEAAGYPLYPLHSQPRSEPGCDVPLTRKDNRPYTTTTTTTPARPLSLLALPDTQIGVVPATPAGLFPCRPRLGSPPNTAAALEWMNLPSPIPYACSTTEVFVVSQAFDGKPCRLVLELAEKALEAADERNGLGTYKPTSATHNGSRRGPSAESHALPFPPFMEDRGDGVVSPTESLSGVPGVTAPVSPKRTGKVIVDEPDRILHVGDVLCCQPTITSSVNGRVSHSGGRAGHGTQPLPTTATTPEAADEEDVMTMRWYVDENMRMEDIILSWMRRLGSRARETRALESRWVRYPPELFQRLLWTEIYYGRPALLFNTTHTLRFPLPSGEGSRALLLSQTPMETTMASAQEEVAHGGVLASLLDIVKDRRFRQWRFSVSGFVYFHGVSVRLPGVTALPAGVKASPQTLEEAQRGTGETEKGPAAATLSGSTSGGKKNKQRETPTSAARVKPGTTCLRLFSLRDGTCAAVAVDDWLHEGMTEGEVDPPLPRDWSRSRMASPPSLFQQYAQTQQKQQWEREEAVRQHFHQYRPSPAAMGGSRSSTPLYSPSMMPPQAQQQQAHQQYQLPQSTAAAAAASPAPYMNYARPGEYGSHVSASNSNSPYSYSGRDGSLQPPHSPYAGSNAAVLSSQQYPPRGGGGGSEAMLMGMGGANIYGGNPTNYGETATGPFSMPSSYRGAMSYDAMAGSGSMSGGGGGSAMREGSSYRHRNASSYVGAAVEFMPQAAGMMPMMMDSMEGGSFRMETMTPLSSVAGGDPARVTTSFFNDVSTPSHTTGFLAGYGPSGADPYEGSGYSTHPPHATNSYGYAMDGASYQGQPPQPPHPQRVQPSRYPVSSQMSTMTPHVVQARPHSIISSTANQRAYLLAHDGEKDMTVAAPRATSHRDPYRTVEVITRSRSGTGERVLYRTSSANQSGYDILPGEPESQLPPAPRHVPQRSVSHHSLLRSEEGRGGAADEMDTAAAAAQAEGELMYTGNSSAYGAMGLSRGGEEEEEDAPPAPPPASHGLPGLGPFPDAPHQSDSLRRVNSRGSHSRGSWRSHNPYTFSSSANNLVGADTRSNASSASLRSPAASFHVNNNNNASSLYATASGGDFVGSLYRTNEMGGAGIGGGFGSGGEQLYNSNYDRDDDAQAQEEFAAAYSDEPAPPPPLSPPTAVPTMSGALPTSSSSSRIASQAEPLRGGHSGPYVMSSPPQQTITPLQAWGASRAAAPTSTPKVGSSSSSGGGRQTVVTFSDPTSLSSPSSCAKPSSRGEPAHAQNTTSSTPFTPSLMATTQEGWLRSDGVFNAPIRAEEAPQHAAASSRDGRGGNRGGSATNGCFNIPSTVVSQESGGAMTTPTTNVRVPAAPMRNTFLKKKK